MTSIKDRVWSIYYIVIIYMFSLWYVIHEIVQQHRKTKVKTQPNRVALITGGGRGIGYETAVQLLDAGMTVIVGGCPVPSQDSLKEGSPAPYWEDCIIPQTVCHWLVKCPSLGDEHTRFLSRCHDWDGPYHSGSLGLTTWRTNPLPAHPALPPTFHRGGKEEPPDLLTAGTEKDQMEGVKTLQKMYNKDNVLFLECDLSSLKSVKLAANKFEELKLPLHILINNAGIMFAPYAETVEGFESHWVTNYLGHFLLTHFLLQSLRKSGRRSEPSRIVNLGSCLHYLGTVDFSDINGRNFYSAEAAYSQSKLAMVMFAITLDRRFVHEGVPVIINSVHPAVAFSKLYQHMWWTDTAIGSIVQRVSNTPAMGSDTVVHAATAEEVSTGGNYFENCSVTDPSKMAQDIATQERLWQLSCQQAGIKEFGEHM